MESRTGFHRTHVELVQRAVDTLGLSGDAYHLPLRRADGSCDGYAQFRRVPGRAYPVLKTVLGPTMTPSGTNIEHLLRKSSK